MTFCGWFWKAPNKGKAKKNERREDQWTGTGAVGRHQNKRNLWRADRTLCGWFWKALNKGKAKKNERREDQYTGTGAVGRHQNKRNLCRANRTFCGWFWKARNKGKAKKNKDWNGMVTSVETKTSEWKGKAKKNKHWNGVVTSVELKTSEWKDQFLQGPGEVALYSIKDKSWYKLPPIPKVCGGVRDLCRCLVFNGNFYVIGGAEKPGHCRWQALAYNAGSRKVYVWNMSGPGRWKECASLPLPGVDPHVGLKDSKVSKFGGYSLYSNVSECEVYDPDGNVYARVKAPISLQLFHHVVPGIGALALRCNVSRSQNVMMTQQLPVGTCSTRATVQVL